MRVLSVGVSRLFRLVEVERNEVMCYRVEQAVKRPVELVTTGHSIMTGDVRVPTPKPTRTHRWEWVPLAFATQWLEAHGALHQYQADFVDKMIERQGSFRGDKTHGE